MKKFVPVYEGELRKHSIQVPRCISECSGIRIFGRRIKSLVFSTDVAIIKNINADAVIAVYPFTPQPAITQAILSVSEQADVAGKLAAGVDFLNVSGAARTPEIVAHIREKFPEVPIIATGGPTDDTIRATIEAGANAITYTPPTSAELFAESMRKYRGKFA